MLVVGILALVAVGCYGGLFRLSHLDDNPTRGCDSWKEFKNRFHGGHNYYTPCGT